MRVSMYTCVHAHKYMCVHARKYLCVIKESIGTEQHQQEYCCANTLCACVCLCVHAHVRMYLKVRKCVCLLNAGIFFFVLQFVVF